MDKNRSSHWLFNFLEPLRKQSWFESLRRSFWSNPDRLMAAKATFAIALLAVPFVIIGQSFIAISLALGALAGALSETDDHPKGRVKSLALKVISFGISSLAVELLRPFPIFLGLGLALSTIVFLLIGGTSERYRGVTFGAILVGIYTMLGTEISPHWYLQPLLLTSGALFYGIFSLILLVYRPYRLLEEQLARGFLALSHYLEEKANLFPSDEKLQGKIRNQLALQNVQMVGALDRCKEVLNSYGDALKDELALKPYLGYFMLLQSLHERAASSHERYDLLSSDPENRELLEGIGQTLLQLSHATKQFANSLLTGVPYRHPVSLGWMVSMLNEQLNRQPNSETHPLALLINNLTRSHRSLSNLSDDYQRSMAPRLAKDQRSLVQRFKDQLSFNHPRMRYAIRLSLCFLVGFAISEVFQLAKGEWIVLTSLFVCQPSYSETRRRLFQRILGTFTGVIGGVLVVQILPTTAGQLILLLGAAFVFFTWLRRKYAVSVVFITIFVLCAFNLIANKGVAVMLPRLIDTLIGSILAIAAVRLLWPEWQYKRLPELIQKALNANANYFRAIVTEYEQTTTDDDLPYRIARRQAHRADNALVLAWQSMQLEPKKRQFFREQAFSLTYLNHALLSYLSAFGAHRHLKNEMNTGLISLARETLSAFQEATKSLEEPCVIDNHPIKEVIEKLKEQVKTNEQGLILQQFILLSNIAEVTGKILERGQLLNQHETIPAPKTQNLNP